MIWQLYPYLHSGGTESTRKSLAGVMLCERINPQIAGILSHLYVQKHQVNAHHSSPQIISAWLWGVGFA